MALDALIGMDSETAWPILQRMINESDDAEIRGRAVWLLSQLETDEAFDLLVQIARSDPDPEVRSNAMFWVGQSAEHSDQALDLLIDMIASGADEESVGQALFGLGQSSDPRAQQALETLARDATRDTELRGQALFWLGQQGSGLALLRDIALNDADEELRGQALFGISQIDSPEANDFLLEIARGDGPVEFRNAWLFDNEINGAVMRLLKGIEVSDAALSLDVIDLADIERPPMNRIPEYRRKRGLPENPDE